jgi:N-methylhydantoinase A
MERRASEDLDVPVAKLMIRREADLRYRRQTHQLPILLEPGMDLRSAWAGLGTRFEGEYERVYGPGTGYRAAGIEVAALRVTATVPADTSRAARAAGATTRGTPARPARRRRPKASGERPVFFDRWVPRTPVFAGERLAHGHRIAGPAVIDWTTTTLVVHPGQQARLDEHGHVHLQLAG